MQTNKRARRKQIEVFGSRREWCTAVELWPTAEQWLALCAILFNRNKDPREFLMCFPGQLPNKATTWKVARHACWTFNALTGTADPTAIGFYPSNAHSRDSYWCAVDFDAHKGKRSRHQAQANAARLVEHLAANYPLLGVIACTSGASGGWHVFIVRTLARPIAEWSLFLRAILREIGVPIVKGVCEIHPHECKPDARPRGILAPGCSKQCAPALIAFDSLTPRLPEWQHLLPTELPTQTRGCPNKVVILLGQVCVQWMCRRHAIRAAHTRHSRLVAMVTAMVSHGSRTLALKAASQLYDEARSKPATTKTEHLADFARVWSDMEKVWLRKRGAVERETYGKLSCETSRAAFRLFCSYVRLSGADFYIHRNTLAARLGVTHTRASQIRDLFCDLGVMRLTALEVPHQGSRRYKWLLPVRA